MASALAPFLGRHGFKTNAVKARNSGPPSNTRASSNLGAEIHVPRDQVDNAYRKEANNEHFQPFQLALHPGHGIGTGFGLPALHRKLVLAQVLRGAVSDISQGCIQLVNFHGIMEPAEQIAIRHCERVLNMRGSSSQLLTVVIMDWKPSTSIVLAVGASEPELTESSLDTRRPACR